MKELLSEEQINRLLNSIPSVSPVSEKKVELEKEKKKKIMIYDFRRPSKFSRSVLHSVHSISEKIANDFCNLLFCEYDLQTNINVYCIDELNFGNIKSGIKKYSPCCNFDWLGGHAFLELDSSIFNYFVGNITEKNTEINGFEKKVFYELICKPLEKIICKNCTFAVGKKLPDFSNMNVFSNPELIFENNPNENGVLICFNIKIDGTEGNLQIFLSNVILQEIQEIILYSKNKNSKIIPLALPEKNVVIEAGRFRIEDNFELEENMIFVTDKADDELLDIYKNEKFIGQGEPLVIENKFAVRVISTFAENDEKTTSKNDKKDNFYNAKVIFGSCTDFKNENGKSIKLKEESIFVLDEEVSTLAKIVKNEKTVAFGEIVIVNESFGIKITKVCAKACANFSAKS